ncbi:hypothetical protein FHR83_001072 [Actinoplanes campanulatus]|uniref:Uncharacterized protein n=1 Tax=Actinoplanes campanulatus TaxID=113559 RepID=A0A7W5ABZ9_9ACTN|nr:hypothetical protein [Actinoplanes campanulatus]GGN50180.1 hypothetical protein GCM10010109_89060 [Actinoplanes campanulatus]GID42446.1 hypothetical protein Aca09nite_89520 [Actinoplanes campanulatus]GID43641.1 hypothetical protein Aca07nite_09160 [Actinoplanes capillaceus]
MHTLPKPEIEIRKPSNDMNPSGAPKMRLIQEALSRARMRRPQSDRAPEAYRSARQITMDARSRASRDRGVGL